jgi:hypothetical protein
MTQAWSIFSNISIKTVSFVLISESQPFDPAASPLGNWATIIDDAVLVRSILDFTFIVLQKV